MRILVDARGAHDEGAGEFHWQANFWRAIFPLLLARLRQDDVHAVIPEDGYLAAVKPHHPRAAFSGIGSGNEVEALARRAAELSAQAFISTCSSHGGDALRALAIVEPDIPEAALQRKAECVKRAVSCIAIHERDLRAVTPLLDRPLPPTVVLYREQGDANAAMNPVIVANFIAKHLWGVGAPPKG